MHDFVMRFYVITKEELVGGKFGEVIHSSSHHKATARLLIGAK